MACPSGQAQVPKNRKIPPKEQEEIYEKKCDVVVDGCVYVAYLQFYAMFGGWGRARANLLSRQTMCRTPL